MSERRNFKVLGRGFARVCVLSVVVLGTWACSPSVVTGDKKSDSPATQSPTNVRVECFEMDLSQSRLSVSAFRDLTSCLNSNGSLNELEAFVKSASDAQMQAILDVLNDEVLLHATRMGQSIQSFDQMDREGVMDPLLRELGKVLSRPRLLGAGARFLADLGLTNGRIDPELLRALEVVSKNLSKDPVSKFNQALEASWQFTQTESYADFVRGLQLPVRAAGGLPSLIAPLANFVKSRALSDREFGKTLITGVADGSLYAGLDSFFGLRERKGASFQWNLADSRVSELSSFTHYLFSDGTGEKRFVPLLRLFKVLEAPVHCMDRTKALPSGVGYLVDEILSRPLGDIPAWVLRDNMLKLKLAASVCDYPVELPGLLGAVTSLAIDDMGAGAPPLLTAADLMKNLGPRYSKVFALLLSESNGVDAETGLRPAAAEFARADRDLTRSILNLSLFATPKSPERVLTQDLAKFLLAPRKELTRIKSPFATELPKEAVSIFDVMASRMDRLNPATLVDLFTAIGDYIGAAEPIAAPFLEASRRALLFNSVQPGIEVLLEVLGNSSRHSDALAAILDLSRKPELEGVLALFGRMQREDQFKPFLRGTLRLFERQALARVKGTAPKVLPYKAMIVADSSRDRARILGEKHAALPRYRFTRLSDNVQAACSALDISFGMEATSHAGWLQEMQNIRSCVNTGGEYAQLDQFLNYATSKASEVRPGKAFVPYILELTNKTLNSIPFNEQREIVDAIGDRLVNASSRAQVKDGLQILEFLTQQNYRAYVGGPKVAVAQVLARACGTLVNESAALKRLDAFLANAVELPTLAPAAANLFDVAAKADTLGAPVEPARPKFSRALQADLERAVQSGTGIGTVESVTYSYWNQLIPRTEKYRFATVDEFFDLIEPLIDRIAGKSSGNSGRVLEQSLEFFKLFDYSPYDPEWWEGWYHRLSNNRRVIWYYYPGQFPDQDKPQLRVVSQIDILEMVVNEANFTLGQIGQKHGCLLGRCDENENFAVRCLGSLALSGDQMQEWIIDMRRDIDQYMSAGNSVLTKLPTMEIKPELKRRLFNLNQIFSALQELHDQVDVAKNPYTGKTVVRSDLGMLRDLFHAVLMATPEGQRRVYHYGPNSLSTIVDLVSTGLLRNAGTSVWEADASGEARKVSIAPILKLLIRAAVTRESSGSLKTRPELLKTLDYLLSREGSETGSFRSKYPTVAAVIQEIFNRTSGDGMAAPGRTRKLTSLKSAVYNLINYIDKMEVRSIRTRGRSMIDPLVQTLYPMLGTQEGATFIRRNLNNFSGFVFSPEASKTMSALNALGNNASIDFGISVIELAASQNAQVVRTSIDLGVALSEGSPSQMDVLVRTLRDLGDDSRWNRFWTKTLRPDLDRAATWLAAHPKESLALQKSIASRMRSGDLSDMVLFMGRASTGNRKDEFYNQIQFLGTPRYQSELKDMIDAVSSGLVDTLK